MVSASTPTANEPAKDLILVHTVQLKPMIKAQISGRMVSSAISDVASASVQSEKTRLKKLMMMMMKMNIIISIMYKSQEMMVFSGRQHWLPLWNWGQKSDGRLQIWCSIHHGEFSLVRLVEKLTRNSYWWVELCMPTLHRECYCSSDYVEELQEVHVFVGLRKGTSILSWTHKCDCRL